MKKLTVSDLMIPLDQYTVVGHDATLTEVITRMRAAQERFGRDRLPARAVLVQDTHGSIIGQIGHLDVLEALEPKYKLLGEIDMLSRGGISQDLSSSLMDNYQVLSDDIDEICAFAADRAAGEVMQPIGNNIDATAGLTEAIHQVVLTHALRFIVLDRGKPAGVLRQTDLFETVAALMIRKKMKL